jgi:hypothetical protein
MRMIWPNARIGTVEAITAMRGIPENMRRGGDAAGGAGVARWLSQLGHTRMVHAALHPGKQVLQDGHAARQCVYLL